MVNQSLRSPVKPTNWGQLGHSMSSVPLFTGGIGEMMSSVYIEMWLSSSRVLVVKEARDTLMQFSFKEIYYWLTLCLIVFRGNHLASLIHFWFLNLFGTAQEPRCEIIM